MHLMYVMKQLQLQHAEATDYLIKGDKAVKEVTDC